MSFTRSWIVTDLILSLYLESSFFWIAMRNFHWKYTSLKTCGTSFLLLLTVIQATRNRTERPLSSSAYVFVRKRKQDLLSMFKRTMWVGLPPLHPDNSRILQAICQYVAYGVWISKLSFLRRKLRHLDTFPLVGVAATGGDWSESAVDKSLAGEWDWFFLSKEIVAEPRELSDISPHASRTALWARTTKTTDWSTAPITRLFAHSLAPLTHSLALDCPLRSRPLLCSLVHSLAHFAHSLARGTVNDKMSQNDLVLSHSGLADLQDDNSTRTKFLPLSGKQIMMAKKDEEGEKQCRISIYGTRCS